MIQPYTKVFSVTYGRRTPGANIAKLHHLVHEPAQKLDVVPELADKYLLSSGKCSEAGYISIYEGEEVNIYDGCTAWIMVSEVAVMKYWRCPQTNMWQLPLQAHVSDLNMYTLLLDDPTGI